jgi:hypothetical protein
MSLSTQPSPLQPMELNQPQWMHLLRAALLSGGPVAAFLIHDEYATQGQIDATVTAIEWLVGVVPPLIAATWGLLIHTKSATIKAVENMRGVIHVQVSPIDPVLKAIADDTSRPKVTTGPSVGSSMNPARPNPTATGKD